MFLFKLQQLVFKWLVPIFDSIKLQKIREKTPQNETLNHDNIKIVII